MTVDDLLTMLEKYETEEFEDFLASELVVEIEDWYIDQLPLQAGNMEEGELAVAFPPTPTTEPSVRILLQRKEDE